MSKPVLIHLNSDYTLVSPAQGSNPGGFFIKNSTGEEYYIKWLHEDLEDHFKDTKKSQELRYKNRNRNRFNNEFLALKLYELFSVSVPKAEFITFIDHDGKKNFGIASKKENGILPVSHPYKNDPLLFKTISEKAQEDFLIDALLANYDVVGLMKDNLHYKIDTGDSFRLDAGGALLYQAQGVPKKQRFDSDVNEFEEMESGDNKKTGYHKGVLEQASLLFKGVNDSPALLVGLNKLLAVSEQKIIDCIHEHGFDMDTEQGIKKNETLITTLLARKRALVNKVENIIFSQLEQKKPSLSDYKLTEGPLPKSIFTYRLEYITRAILNEEDFEFKKINNEYIITVCGMEMNWTEIINHANLEHIKLNEDDFNSYTHYLENTPKMGAFFAVKPSLDKDHEEDYKKMLYNDCYNDAGICIKPWPTAAICFQEMQAINLYTSGFYQSMNSLLRGTFDFDIKSKAESKAALLHSILCMSGLNKLPNMNIKNAYRGTSMTALELKSAVVAAQGRRVVELAGFISSSIEEFSNYAFARLPVHLHFSGPLGLKGAYIAPISCKPGEQEFLIPPTQIQIIKYHYDRASGTHSFEARTVSDLASTKTKSMLRGAPLHYDASHPRFKLFEEQRDKPVNTKELMDFFGIDTFIEGPSLIESAVNMGDGLFSASEIETFNEFEINALIKQTTLDAIKEQFLSVAGIAKNVIGLTKPECIEAIREGLFTLDDVKDMDKKAFNNELLKQECLNALRNGTTCIALLAPMSEKELKFANQTGDYPRSPRLST